MIYKVFGYLHAAASWRVREIRRLAGETGQGTVEYVGLILLVSLATGDPFDTARLCKASVDEALPFGRAQNGFDEAGDRFLPSFEDTHGNLLREDIALEVPAFVDDHDDLIDDELTGGHLLAALERKPPEQGCSRTPEEC